MCDTDDSAGDGPCTLRAAIEQANFDGGTDTIEFSIAGAGPHTISPGSALPTIIDPVIIDGTSEPDFVSTPIVELDGTSAGSVTGLVITGGSSTVKGLVINRFALDGIELDTSGSNTIEGNYIGTDATGAIDLGNGRFGVFIAGGPSNAVGGTVSGAGNVISGNSIGVTISGGTATGNTIEGNFIGTDATGTAVLGNTSTGVTIFTPNNTVGGTASGARNVISGNGSGVSIVGASGNKVQGNYIGTDASGTADLGNSSNGVHINAASGNTIGGSLAGASNTIAFNGGDGVRVDGAFAIGNTIRRNSIHSNTGMGIENISGGNTELTPPTITASGSASGTSTCLSCTIDVYSDDADEGEVHHGSTTTDGGTGNWSFSGAVVGPNVNATVTDGSGNTSEFSASLACTDTDIDTVCDSGDNCPTTSNVAQTDTDSDGKGDACDPCPTIATFGLWLVPVGDDDCDGTTSADETVIGTDPNDPCGLSAWPPDFDDNAVINTTDVFQVLAPFFGTAVPPTSVRRDLFPDGVINTTDVFRVLPPFLGSSCVP